MTIRVPANRAQMVELASMAHAVHVATGRYRTQIGRHAFRVLKAQPALTAHAWAVVLVSSRRPIGWHAKFAQLAG